MALGALCGSALVATAPLALAQYNPLQSGQPQAALAVEPRLPEPYEPITVSLRDAGSGLQGARIDWFVDGSTPLSDAANRRSVAITAPGPGETLTISAVLRNGDERERIQTVIAPKYLDIVVEPQTRTPPFYKGRPHASSESTVRLVALINGSEDGVRDLSYRWEIEGDVIEDGRVRGGNEVVTTLPRRRDVTIDVEVFNAFNEKIAEKRFRLGLSEPQIRFYEVSGLYGLSRIAADRDLLLSDSSVTLQAEPLYLGFETYNQPDVLTWSIGGQRQRPSGNPYRVTLERLLGSGSTDVEFQVQDTARFLQGAKDELTVRY